MSGPAVPDPGEHGPGNRWCECHPDWHHRRQSDPSCPLDAIAEFALFAQTQSIPNQENPR